MQPPSFGGRRPGGTPGRLGRQAKFCRRFEGTAATGFIRVKWYSKKIVGYYAGVQSKSEHWLEALNMAINRQFPDGARGQGLNLMSDNGCQPTSKKFMESCSLMGVQQAFTSYNNPKGNGDTERVMRTFKEEKVWLTEWKSPFVSGIVKITPCGI